MTTATRAAKVAEIHRGSINASRVRAGFAPLTSAELASEFGDVDRLQVRATGATRRTFSNAGAADSMWSGIVAKLNASVPASRSPIAAVRTSPATSFADGRVDAVVDWSAIARNLNAEAGLKAPARGGTR
jgi:hypothetical protein